MTFVQLEYIVAADTWRHFATAAAHCFVTQPTLSMQVHKLEKELEVKIFDRSKQPVIPTEAGRELIEQARKILAEKGVIGEMVQAKKGAINGELRIGIIPTLAPYLLPLFVPGFTAKYPHIRLVVGKMTTDLLVSALREGRIDTGSLETLRRMVELNDGITILPELAVLDLSGRQLQGVRHFKRPAPMREVSLVVHRDFVKQRLIDVLRQEIVRAVPEKLRQNENLHVVPI
jgi:DNA-binding transcriptional LysR family regulator